jgi:hypothetical protein
LACAVSVAADTLIEPVGSLVIGLSKVGSREVNAAGREAAQPTLTSTCRSKSPAHAPSPDVVIVKVATNDIRVLCTPADR